MQKFELFEDIDNFLKNIHLKKGKFSFTFDGKENGKNKNFQVDVITNATFGKYQLIINGITQGVYSNKNINGIIQGFYSTKNELLEGISTELTKLGFKSKKEKTKVSNLNEKNLDFSIIEKIDNSKEYFQKFKGNNSEFDEYFYDEGVNSIAYKNKTKNELLEMETKLSSFAFEKQNQKYNLRIQQVKRNINLLVKSIEETEYIENLTNGTEEKFSSPKKEIEKTFEKLINKSKENKNLISSVRKINDLFSTDKNALSKFEFLFDNIKTNIEEKGFLVEKDLDNYVFSILENSSPSKLFEYGGPLEALFKMIKEKDSKDYEQKYAYKLRFDDYKRFNGNQQIVFKNEEDAIEKFKSIQNEFGQGEVGILYKGKINESGVETFGKEYKYLFTKQGLETIIKERVIERDYRFDKGGEEEYSFDFERQLIYTKKTKTEINDKFNNSNLRDFMNYVMSEIYTKEGIEIVII